MSDLDTGPSVAEVRRRAGLTQQQLADLSGVAQPNIAAYEKGTRRPSVKMMRRLETAARPRPSLVIARNRAKIAEIARRHQARSVKVFGSVARGEDQPGSDVDLLIAFEPGTSLFELVELEQELEELLGVGVDVVSEGGLRPGHEQILREARPL
jgi:predicted nucleotidyltransferase